MYYSDYKHALLKYGEQHFAELVEQLPYRKVKTFKLPFLLWMLEAYFQ